jgi:muramoyltetrapeptide carboxypeptidase
MDRKRFLSLAAAGLGATKWLDFSALEEKSSFSSIMPKMLERGDTISIISPAGGVRKEGEVELAISNLNALGYRAIVGDSLGKKMGYLGGRDSERVQDLHDAFSTKESQAIIALRGGYGATRLLPLIDFSLIKKNPKPLIGYSDITSLLTAIHQETGLITFHGPNALDRWSDYTKDHFQTIFSAKKGHKLVNHQDDRIQTLVPGDCLGPIVGGNLTLLSQTMGTPWEIDTKDKILFIEETNEAPYRIDRMLTQLWLARKLHDAKGFIIGQITGAGSNDSELNWEAVIRDRLVPLGKPTIMNFSVGHTENMLTLAVGAKVYMNASARTVTLHESLK